MKGTWPLLRSTPSDLHFGAARGAKASENFAFYANFKSSANIKTIVTISQVKFPVRFSDKWIKTVTRYNCSQRTIIFTLNTNYADFDGI